MEYWIWRNEIYFYMDGTEQEIKSDHHPLFISSPIFYHSIGFLTANMTLLDSSLLISSQYSFCIRPYQMKIIVKGFFLY